MLTFNWIFEKQPIALRILTQPSRYKKRNQFASWRLYIYIFYGSIRTRKLKNFVHVRCLIMNFRRQPVGKRRRIFCNFNMSCRHVRISFFCGGWVGIFFSISYFSWKGICTLYPYSYKLSKDIKNQHYLCVDRDTSLQTERHHVAFI